jgi:DNA polymerase-1
VVKACFIPKNHAFIFADYPNIELKLLALYLELLEWPSMGQVFRDGADLHTITTASVLGVPIEQVTDDQRQIGKRLNFSIVYGGGVPTLIRQLGITAPEALEMLRSYHATWPGIGWESKRRPADPGTLIHSIKSRIAERGYITTLYGRHLHPRSMHSALNALCQGCAADLMKWAMLEVNDNLLRGGFKSHIVNTVHDELMLDVTEDELPDLARLVPQWMTDQRIEDIVPIQPSCEVAYTSWAAKEEYVG